MNALEIGLQIIRRGIDDAAQAFAGGLTAVSRPRRITLVEQPDGEFLISASGPAPERFRFVDATWTGSDSKSAATHLAGRQVELILASRRFLFRELELPRRAGEFLEGVVRAQIDRLTPWKPQEALFGWSDPVVLAADRIAVTVAATPRTAIAALIASLESAHVRSLTISTPFDGEEASERRIQVAAERGGSAMQWRGWRPILVGALVGASLAAFASCAATMFLGSAIDNQTQALQREIATRRAALLEGRGSAENKALTALNAKKRATPAGVIVIDALSRALPDDAYLTRIHLEGKKLEISGLAQDPPGLIRLIEQSRYFKHAAFNAPTTQTPNERGERFHIEALAQPVLEAAP